MQPPRVLIAGIGNIFLGDDAFGVEVVRRLALRPLPVGVRVVDFGIRGLHLAYALMDGYESVILVDAVPRGGAPGTVYCIEPQVNLREDSRGAPASFEAHNLNPAAVLRLVASLGGEVQHLLVVGCEPETVAEDMCDGMSAPVMAAIPEAVELIETLVARLLNSNEGFSNVAEAVEAAPPVENPR
jgi:hydrogenase maturation protease